METNSIFLLGIFLVLLLNGCSAVALKANSRTSSRLDPNLNGTGGSNERTVVSNLITNTAEVGKVKEGKGDQLNKTEERIDNKNNRDKNNTNMQSNSKEMDNVQKANSDSNGESKTKEENDRKDNRRDKVKSKDASKKGGNDEDSDQLRKEGNRVEECDSSNKCVDENKQFVACLRVPGNDSPDLSLLIQNKVKGPLTVSISAPDFVELEKTKVQLQEKEDNELKVSVRSRGTDSLIIIMAGNGNCSLDFKDLIARSSWEEFDNSVKSTYSNFLSQKPTIAFISFAALLILASGCMYVSFRFRQLSNGASKYQRLDMKLPVIDAGKPESDNNDGWDNSWGDDWDDEEAPKTPSLPVTPSLSSKGLASRRLSKEGWKD